VTLPQAVAIASIFEFCGVLFLGASVTSTVRGKIFNTSDYEDMPEIVLLGMFTSLVSASFMMMVATYMGMPVSTTHTVIGCIIGFAVSTCMLHLEYIILLLVLEKDVVLYRCTHLIPLSLSSLSSQSAANGIQSVNWDETKNIFISWVAAPILTGIAAFCIYGFIRHFILMSENPFERGYYSFSFVLFATIGVNLFFILNKGTKNFDHFQEHVYDNRWVVPTSFGVGLFVGLVWLFPFGPFIKRKMEAKRAAAQQQQETDIAQPSSPQSAAIHPLSSLHSIGSSIGSHREIQGEQMAEYDVEEGSIKLAMDKSVKSVKLIIDSERMSEESTEHATNLIEGSIKSVKSLAQLIAEEASSVTRRKPKKKRILVRFAEATFRQNLEEQSFQESRTTEELWRNSSQYDSDVEHLFTYVQVFTVSICSTSHLFHHFSFNFLTICISSKASLSSFAHGANDIANAVAPLAAIIDIYQTGEINPEAPVQKWILAYGGVALVLGLLLYGYKVMKTIGYKLTALSPTRGSSASLAASLLVVTASYIGIPVSTTQCIVGAVAGIGLVEGKKNVQWWQLVKVCISWVVVFFVACLISAMLFSLCAYSPSMITTV
jgi:sodium-dependent phosphate transporter